MSKIQLWKFNEHLKQKEGLWDQSLEQLFKYDQLSGIHLRGELWYTLREQLHPLCDQLHHISQYHLANFITRLEK